MRCGHQQRPTVAWWAHTHQYQQVRPVPTDDGAAHCGQPVPRRLKVSMYVGTGQGIGECFGIQTLVSQVPLQPEARRRQEPRRRRHQQQLKGGSSDHGYEAMARLGNMAINGDIALFPINQGEAGAALAAINICKCKLKTPKFQWRKNNNVLKRFLQSGAVCSTTTTGGNDSADQEGGRCGPHSPFTSEEETHLDKNPPGHIVISHY